MSEEFDGEIRETTGNEKEAFHDSIKDAFRKAAEISGSYPALIYDGVYFSYHTLDQMSSQLSEFLVENGCKDGVEVVLCLPMSPQLIISYMGVLKSGATPLILGELTRSEFNSISKSIDSRWAIVSSGSSIETRDGTKVITARIGDLLTFLKSRKTDHGQQARPKGFISTLTEIILDRSTHDTSIYEKKDSATGFLSFRISGEPEILRFSDSSLLSKANSCRKAILNQGIKFRNASVLPASTPEGLIFSLIIPVLTGGYLISGYGVDSFRRIARDADNFNANFISITPEMLASVKDSNIRNRDRIKGIIVNSFFSPAELKKVVSASLGGKLIEYFGTPENCGITHISDSSSSGRIKPLDPKETSLLDEDGNLIEEQEKAGSLWGRIMAVQETDGTEQQYLGYRAQYVDSKALARISIDRDLGMINGKSVSGKFLEDTCGIPPNVKETAAVFISDGAGNSNPVFFCVSDGQVNPDEKKILAFLRSSSSFLGASGNIIWRKELPRSLSGKVLKNILLAEK